MKQQLILIGGGGHCKSCIEVILATGQYDISGVLDMAERVGGKVLGFPVIGTDDALSTYVSKDVQFLITVGQIKNARIRKQLYEKLKNAGAALATVIAPTAIVSSHSIIGAGTIIMHGAVVNADVRIGENCIINTYADIEHDCTIGEHVHVSTHATVNGNCSIGNSSFIGSGAIIANGVSVGEEIVIGAGAVVIRSCGEPGFYVGNPARKI